MKLKTSTIILIIGCIVGLSLLLYPSFSDYWNSKYVTHAIVGYNEVVQELDTTDYQALWNEAQEYNRDLLKENGSYHLSDQMKARYHLCLALAKDGLMGYIEIPKINVTLSIYHGTSDNVLQTAVGHIEWSSLPTGGIGTHCVLSGHRGLLSAKLFTDLDELREGDIFTLNVLNETLTYEVDQLRTVLPNELSDLVIDPDKDYCTLVTCTPYGINTHRLLVRGHRIENIQEAVHVVSEAVIIDPLVAAPVMASPLLFILFMMVMLKKPEKKKQDVTIIIPDDKSE